MKNFISKNWKNFLIAIGIIFLVIDLFFIVTTPANIPQDFLEYGPNIESDIFDKATEISVNIGDTDSSDESASGDSSMNQ